MKGLLPPLSRKEEKKLYMEIQRLKDAGLNEQWLQARNKLVQHNLAYIRQRAGEMQSKTGFAHQDLIQEGCLGLIRAIDDFDPNRGVRFLTYASHWVTKYMMYASIQGQNALSEPPYIWKARNAARTFVNQYILKYGSKPPRETIIKELKNVQGIKSVVTRVRWDKNRCLSLNTAPGASHNHQKSANIANGQWIDRLPSNAPMTDETCNRVGIIKAMRKLIDGLEPRDKKLLTLRFGLDGNKPQTLRQIAPQFKNLRDPGRPITFERVRQLEESLLKQLRGVLERENINLVEEVYE